MKNRNDVEDTSYVAEMGKGFVIDAVHTTAQNVRKSLRLSFFTCSFTSPKFILLTMVFSVHYGRNY